MLRLLKLLAYLPLPALYALASVMAPLVQHGLRYRHTLVTRNIDAAFPDWSPARRRRLRRDFYRHLCNVAVETLWSTNASAAQMRRRVRFENVGVVDTLLAERRPILFLTLHQGNWEWLLNAVSDHLPCPLDAIYKPLHDSASDTLLRASRSRFGGNPIPFAEAVREMLRRRREFRAFAMVADQAPFKKDKRHWAGFLGRPAPFYLGPQKIAEVTRYPVVFVSMQRRRRGYYRARFELLAEPPYARGGSAIIDRYVAACEQSIREQPATWLWSHDKWKRPRPGDDDHGDLGATP